MLSIQEAYAKDQTHVRASGPVGYRGECCASGSREVVHDATPGRRRGTEQWVIDRFTARPVQTLRHLIRRPPAGLISYDSPLRWLTVLAISSGHRADDKNWPHWKGRSPSAAVIHYHNIFTLLPSYRQALVNRKLCQRRLLRPYLWTAGIYFSQCALQF